MAWTSEYWDTIREFFWSPDWLGCMRIRDLCPDCRNRRPSMEKFSEIEVLSQLRRREETLNHVINIFFQLLPDQVTSRLLSAPFATSISDTFEVIGTEAQDRYGFRSNVTQQDLFLVAPANIFCVELKLGARSDLMQVAKYALLCALEEDLTGRRGSLRLVYLAPDQPFHRLWKEKFSNSRELEKALGGFDPAISAKKSLRPVFEENARSVKDVMARLQIGFLSYSQFAEALEAEKADLDEQVPAEQTLLRLIDGMLTEMVARNLISLPSS